MTTTDESGAVSRGAVPSGDELIVAVVECLRDELLPGATGRNRYLLQVCVAALEIVLREHCLAAQVEEAQVELLRALGHPDTDALLAEVRADPAPERFAVLVAALRTRVEAELAVVRPDALGR